MPKGHRVVILAPMDTSAKPAQREIAPLYLLILAAPVSVYLLLKFLLKRFGDGAVALPVAGFAEQAQLLELVGRYKFMAAFAFFGAASVAVLIIFALDLWANYTKRTRLWSVIAILGSAAFGLLLSVFEPAAFGNFETYYLVGQDFFETALGQGQTGPGGGYDSQTSLDLFRLLTDPINALTSFGVAAAMTGLILALAKPADATADAAARAKALVESQRISQRYLFCSGVLLTAGMTFLIAWVNWPGPMIAEADVRAAYNELIGALTLYIGVGYSVLILSCYLPVMLILTLRSERLRQQMTVIEAEAAGPLPELKYTKALNAIVAILSPVLASAIGSFGQGILFP